MIKNSNQKILFYCAIILSTNCDLLIAHLLPNMSVSMVQNAIAILGLPHIISNFRSKHKAIYDVYFCRRVAAYIIAFTLLPLFVAFYKSNLDLQSAVFFIKRSITISFLLFCIWPIFIHKDKFNQFLTIKLIIDSLVVFASFYYPEFFAAIQQDSYGLEFVGSSQKGAGIYGNANLAAYNLSYSMTIFIIESQRKKLGIILKMLLLCLSTTAIVLTASRSGLLVTFFGLCTLANNQAKHRFKILIAIGIVFLTLFNQLTNVEYILLKLTDLNSSVNIESNYERYRAAYIAYDLFLENPITGVGFLNRNLLDIQPHNYLLSYVLDVGFIGLPIIIILLGFVFKNITEQFSYQNALIVFAIFFILIMTDHQMMQNRLSALLIIFSSCNRKTLKFI